MTRPLHEVWRAARELGPVSVDTMRDGTVYARIYRIVDKRVDGVPGARGQDLADALENAIARFNDQPDPFPFTHTVLIAGYEPVTNPEA